MNQPVCEHCKAPASRHVSQPRPMFLCWGCYDQWRRWYFGRHYIFCLPLAELIQHYAHMQRQP